MMALVGQQLKAADIHAQGFMDEEQLITEQEKGEGGLLIIGGGVENEARTRLRARCGTLNVLVLEHHGGPGPLVESISGLLG